MTQKRICSIIERAVETGSALSDTDMEFLAPYLQTNELHPDKASVNHGCWVDEKGDVYTAWLQRDPFTAEWHVGGTTTLDWVTWNKTHMVREENRYRSSFFRNVSKTHPDDPPTAQDNDEFKDKLAAFWESSIIGMYQSAVRAVYKDAAQLVRDGGLQLSQVDVYRGHAARAAIISARADYVVTICRSFMVDFECVAAFCTL